MDNASGLDGIRYVCLRLRRYEIHTGLVFRQPGEDVPRGRGPQPFSSRRSLNPSLRLPDLIWLATVLSYSPRSSAIVSVESPPRNLEMTSSPTRVSQPPRAAARSRTSAIVVVPSGAVNPASIS